MSHLFHDPVRHRTLRVMVCFALLAAWPAVSAAQTPEPRGGQPLPVRDVDNPALAPFQHEIQFLISGFHDETLFTVPMGERAVIETISARLGSPPSEVGTLVRLVTTVDGVEAGYSLVMNEQGILFTTQERAATHAVRLYADPGTPVRVQAIARSGSNLTLSVSGYRVPIP